MNVKMGKNELINTLKNELLHGFRVLPKNDTDIKSLVIWCNPNYQYGSDKMIRDLIAPIIQEFISDGIIKPESFKVRFQKRTKTFIIYNYIKESDKD